MLKLTNLLAKWARQFAQWLSPLPSLWRDDVLDVLQRLIEDTKRFDPATAGEYKRQWVIHRAKKIFPHIRRRVLHLHLEYQLAKDEKE